MAKATVHPSEPVSGTIRVPGDKSVSQRLAMMAGISEGTSVIHGYLKSEDCLSTLNAMVALGATAEFNGDALLITGTGGPLRAPSGPLDLGNSGTGIRLMTGLLAGFPIRATLTGDQYLQDRPMERVRAPLALMGAEVALTDGKPPIHVKGGAVKAIEYELPMASAQVKSCVMLAALHAEGTTTIIEPAETRDYTEKIFAELGVPVRVNGLHIEMDGFGAKGPCFKARDWNVPGDFSSAAFWLVAGALRPGTELVIENVGLNSRRTALMDVLKRMGAHIEVKDIQNECGTLLVSGSRLRGTVVEKSEIPNLIDELPLLAMAGALAEGETVIREAEELRVKESDRISSTVSNLRAVGVEVEEFQDGMIVRGPNKISPIKEIDSYGDHRIAMGMSILALFGEAPAIINNVGCINTSYPAFWHDLETLGAHVTYGE